MTSRYKNMLCLKVCNNTFNRVQTRPLFLKSIRNNSTLNSATNQKELLFDLNKLSLEPEDESQNDENTEKFTELKQEYVESEKLPEYIPLKSFSAHYGQIPRLKHHLKSTLFSPGVHYLSDPRTGVFNFHESLGDIPHVNQFKMDKISNFTPAGRDTSLLNLSNFINGEEQYKEPISYYSSTSSMTGILTKFHRLLSNNRPINTSAFSKFFPETTQFTRTVEVPTSIVVTPKNDEKTIYSLDADRSTDSEITLSVLGSALELMLTQEPKDFAKYLKSSLKEPPVDESCYHFAKIGKFLIRSQLDAVEDKLPYGTFDIKTRAVCSIRFDLAHTDYYPTNYEITKTHGLFESFERELFDAARIVMFKYSLQARLGDMDGIFMAFHNIKKFLGFQYLPLTEIDNLYFGELLRDEHKYGKDTLERKIESDSTKDIKSINQNILENISNDFGNHYQNKREALSTFIGDYELRMSMNLLQNLLDEIIKDTKGKPFRIMFKKMKMSNISPEEKTEPNEEASDIESESEPEVDLESKALEKESKFKQREYSPTSLIAVVNVLEDHEVSQLQMLTKEKIESNKEILSELQTNPNQITHRVKLFAKHSNHFKNEFYKVNRSILKNSNENKGFFAYELKIDHYFDGKKSTVKYPMPTVDILDKSKNYKWEFKYSINKINRDSDKKYLYSKFVKNLGANSFRPSDVDDEFAEYYSKNEIKFDDNATSVQNITRAYSSKAIKRKEAFDLLNPRKKKKRNSNKKKKYIKY